MTQRFEQLPLLDTTPRPSTTAPVEAAAETPAAPTKSARPHRSRPVPAADRLARRGLCVCVVLRDGADGWEGAAVRAGQSAPAWRAVAARLATEGRVRLYDRSPRCVWDSADGAMP